MMLYGSRNMRILRKSAFVALFLLFIFITREVTNTHGFMIISDAWFDNFLLSIRTPFILHIFNAVTLLGNTIVVVTITGIAGIFLLFSKQSKAYVAGLVAAVIGAGSADYIMKTIIERARPSGLIPSTIETSFSFPSGHATAGMALYGFLAYILCKLYPRHAPIIVTVATIVILAIGFSRLYLGVHFPSDVYAGYLLGGLWLLIGIEIVALIKRNDIMQ